MNHDYDVIVLGAGAPGEHCAAALAGGGLRVALVERELLGGECSYWACIPSKTLLRPGEAIAAARDVPGAREAITGALDSRAALAWRDFMVSDYDDAGQLTWAGDAGIEVLRGRGRLRGPHVVAVDDVPYTADHVVIATGADPVIPPIPGLPGLPGVWTNREVTGLTEIPRRLVVLGGATGVEMSQALARMGATVVLVERAEHVPPREPRPIGDAIASSLAADGVDVRVGSGAERVGLEAGEYVLALADGAEVRGDRLLVAAGRRPRVDGIGLETVGVAADSRGLAVDERLSIGPGLWAIGDVSSVGAADGSFVTTVSLSGVPRAATYTRAYDSRPGFLALVSDGEVLTGAYAVGPEAGESLQQATLAIRARVPLAVLLDVIQPFPTFSEAVLQALRDLDRQVAHLHGAAAVTTSGRTTPAMAAASASSLASRGGGYEQRRRRPRLDDLAAEIAEAGGKALIVEADITDPERAAEAVQETLDALGRLDVLVNNAGVMLSALLCTRRSRTGTGWFPSTSRRFCTSRTRQCRT